MNDTVATAGPGGAAEGGEMQTTRERSHLKILSLSLSLTSTLPPVKSQVATDFGTERENVSFGEWRVRGVRFLDLGQPPSVDRSTDRPTRRGLD